MDAKHFEFIKNNTYSLAVKKGADKKIAAECANAALSLYKKGQYQGKPLDLIEAKAKEAAKRTSNEKKKANKA